MRTIYRAIDGKIFETEEECKEYENEYCLPSMWDSEGNLTTDLNGDACLVYLTSIEEIEYFIHLCDDEGVITDGLTNPDGTRDTKIKPGFYYYNTRHGEWLEIPEAFVDRNL